MNINTRMKEVKANTLNHYLQYAKLHNEEYEELVSALTIHTTSWFRERPHFIKLEKYIQDNIDKFLLKEFLVKCSPSSTGEEVYTMAMVLESIKEDHSKFNYKVYGEDIDPLSIKKAKKPLYRKDDMGQVPKAYHKYLLEGHGHINHLFTIKKKIRHKCTFKVGNLINSEKRDQARYDLIFCRNCLIYFKNDDVVQIVKNLKKELKKDGLFSDRCAAILLTGMGNDGANALFDLKKGKAMTFCQDQKSCVVFGMPKVAINLGAAGFIGNIAEIRQQIDKIITL